MKTYQIKLDDEMMRLFKVESSKAEKTIKQFIIEAVLAKIELEKEK